MIIFTVAISNRKISNAMMARISPAIIIPVNFPAFFLATIAKTIERIARMGAMYKKQQQIVANMSAMMPRTREAIA